MTTGLVFTKVIPDKKDLRWASRVASMKKWDFPASPTDEGSDEQAVESFAHNCS